MASHGPKGAIPAKGEWGGDGPGLLELMATNLSVLAGPRNVNHSSGEIF